MSPFAPGSITTERKLTKALIYFRSSRSYSYSAHSAIRRKLFERPQRITSSPCEDYLPNWYTASSSSWNRASCILNTDVTPGRSVRYTHFATELISSVDDGAISFITSSNLMSSITIGEEGESQTVQAFLILQTIAAALNTCQAPPRLQQIQSKVFRRMWCCTFCPVQKYPLLYTMTLQKLFTMWSEKRRKIGEKVEIKRMLLPSWGTMVIAWVWSAIKHSMVNMGGFLGQRLRKLYLVTRAGSCSSTTFVGGHMITEYLGNGLSKWLWGFFKPFLFLSQR